jgi:glyoxylase-like metal-dependent hydrolase (beta-lactamase superfamily II)
MNARITKVSRKLYLIALSPPIEGFDDFISVWLYKGSPSFIVDVGPAVTVSQLLTALEELDVHGLDYVFLTHVHIDHAGGVSDFSAVFSETPVICHPAAIPHLTDPSMLWEGSVKTLGNIARAYEPIKPVYAGHLVNVEDFSSNSVVPILTPGHSPHHVSYQFQEYLFAGEAGGVFISELEYLRPATPSRFFLETSVQSIDRLIELDSRFICYSHFGMRQNCREMLKKSRSQLFRWERVIGEEIEKFYEDNFLTNCMDRLLQEDPLLSRFYELNPAKRERERYFLKNSIQGFGSAMKAADYP